MGLIVALIVTLVAGLLIDHRRPPANARPVPRRSQPVLAAGDQLVAGGRTGSVVTSSQAFRTWLAQGIEPSPEGPYAPLANTALSDLYSLTLHNGGVIASTKAAWHYVWPRDSAFAAAAFARTGHLDDAVGALTFLQDVQAPDGSFQARYLPDGSGPPDARGIQDDGPGWALWSVDEVIAAARPDQRSAIVTRLQPLVGRSLRRLLDRTTGPGALPAASEDYWEKPQSVLTLGIAAPTLAGLEAGSRLIRASDPAEADLASRRAIALQSSIEAGFGSTGYSRYVGGSGPDAAVAFTLPPYVDAPLHGAESALRAAVPALLQPGGGISPGATWPHDNGTSWTPETALFLLAAAGSGDAATARGWLTWFATLARRGTLPEKVDRAGAPGDVAPLAWTDALVILALDRLDLISPKS